MDEGLNWNEAHEVSHEEMLLLLAQGSFRKEAEHLRDEGNRMRFMAMADPEQVQKRLDSLDRRRITIESKFYRDF
jgi:deoxyribodipyrimidine photolyase-like uncharacterized protein